MNRFCKQFFFVISLLSLILAQTQSFAAMSTKKTKNLKTAPTPMNRTTTTKPKSTVKALQKLDSQQITEIKSGKGKSQSPTSSTGYDRVTDTFYLNGQGWYLKMFCDEIENLADWGIITSANEECTYRGQYIPTPCPPGSPDAPSCATVCCGVDEAILVYEVLDSSHGLSSGDSGKSQGNCADGNMDVKNADSNNYTYDNSYCAEGMGAREACGFNVGGCMYACGEAYFLGSSAVSALDACLLDAAAAIYAIDAAAEVAAKDCKDKNKDVAGAEAACDKALKVASDALKEPYKEAIETCYEEAKQAGCGSE